MNWIKKILSLLGAGCIATSTMTAMSAFADNTIQMYTDFTYVSSTRVKVNVWLKNCPAVFAGGYHVELGNGLKLLTTLESDDLEHFDIETTGTNSTYVSWSAIKDTTMTNGAFMCFATSGNSPINPNKPLISFYADIVDTDDVTATIVAGSHGNYVDQICYQDAEGKITDSTTFELTIIDKPVMIESTEYVVGDVNNDGYINAIDASCILVAMNNNFNVPISVHSIDSHFNMFFPNAQTKESPDANKDEWIDSDDSDEIMSYYSAMSSGHTYNGYVGQTDYYETYV